MNSSALLKTSKTITLAGLALSICMWSGSAQAQTTPAPAAHAPATTSTASNTPVSANQPLIIDIPEINDELVTDSAAVDGLRQKVLLNQPDVTIVLLSFEKDGIKANHTAPGTATITVLKGAIDFDVLGKQHHVAQHQTIVLQPNVTHNLKASEKSLVLVTISKNAAAGPAHAD